MTIAEIYNSFNIGSEGFCRAVETHCGYDILREQVARIAERAKTAEEFHNIWANEAWWI